MSNPLYHAGQEIVVRGTSNYGMFKFDPRNRPVSNDKLEKLYDSVAKVNLLREFPIVVTPDFYVMDGQHRLKVAEALSVPVYYIVSDKATIEYITMTTDAVSKWDNENYLHRWCAEGKKDYLDLQAFWLENRSMKGKKFLSLALCAELCHYGDMKRMKDCFRHGGYVCNDLPYAESVVKALKDWSMHIDFYHHICFVYAIRNLMANSDYDHLKMMHKLEYLSTKMVRCTDVESYIALIDSLYNWGVQQKNRVELRKIYSGDPKYRRDKKQPPSLIAA